MPSISKREAAEHKKIEAKLQSWETLTYEDKLEIYAGWNPGAYELNALDGAFFTPVPLANDLQICVGESDRKILDLCAGMGLLSFLAYHRITHDHKGNLHKDPRLVVCVEKRKSYVEMGRKLFPEAHWIHGDITNQGLMAEILEDYGEFDCVVSNPPFGRIAANKVEWAGYKGSNFEYKAIAVARTMAKRGLFIAPQNSVPFKYSGNRYMEYLPEDRWSTVLKAFVRDTGLEILPDGVGIDTTTVQDLWHGVSPSVEVCEVVFKDD